MGQLDGRTVRRCGCLLTHPCAWRWGRRGASPNAGLPLPLRIDEIHADFHNLAVHEMVPCNCAECRNAHRPHFFRHELLPRYLRRGRHDITCEMSLEDVDVQMLLREVIPPKLDDREDGE